MARKKQSRKSKEKSARVEKAVAKALLHFLRNRPDHSFNHRQIAAGANVKGRLSHKKLIGLLEQLSESGQITALGRGKYSHKASTTKLEGTLDVARDGFGFLVPDEEGAGDIFIPEKKMNRAFHGDRVAVRITRYRGRGGRPEGEVVKIVQRQRSAYIGVVEKAHGQMVFTPDEVRIGRDFLIDSRGTGDAKSGQKVLVEIESWQGNTPVARVTRVLGDVGENNAEMHAILWQFGFEPEFPQMVEMEMEKFGNEVPKDEIKRRRDMRPITTFTIDPPDAKDFDDALSIEFLDNGHYSVGVHIADVSFYVQPGTALDDEALHRATSVYLVDRTVPMLPEKLSNNLCSLVPNKDRLCFSAIFEIDDHGKVHKQWFGRTTIHSDRRFAYLEAQAIMDAGEGEFHHELTTLNNIALKLRAERFKRGSINFEEDEVKFELDAEGKPIRVFRKVRKDAHKMIEDWMLLANRKVSEYVSKIRLKPALPFIYRVHDRPDQEKLANLRTFVATLGYELDLEQEDDISRSLNSLMMDVEGRPEQSMVQQVAVRTMAKAIYSTGNIGHYGLGFKFYSHFTSPIRRYPDLMVHRLLAQYLDGNYSANPNKLMADAKHCNLREKRAVEAERASIKYKQVEFLEDKIGEQFEGIVTGVTKWGIYVELTDNKCEGMIGLHDMKDDYYEVDEENYCVRGRSYGETIRLGDKLLIEIKGTSLRNRTIDFSLVEYLRDSLEDHQDAIPVGYGPTSNSKSKRRK